MAYIGQKLKEQMQKTSVSKEELAVLLSMNIMTIEDLLNDKKGTKDISESMLLAIETALNCNIDYFEPEKVKNKNFKGIAKDTNKNIASLHQNTSNAFEFLKDVKDIF